MSPDDNQSFKDDIKLIRDLVKNLPEDLREIVSLHFFSKMTFSEISEVMDIPLGTALWKGQKALGQLRDNFTTLEQR